jgi:TPR repeat protein
VQAERHYRTAAAGDHESAQLALGDLIAERATNMEQWREAVHWYRLAAQRGSSGAKARLAEVAESQLPSAVKELEKEDVTTA